MSDVTGEFIDIKQRAVDGKPGDATGDECGDLWGQVVRIRIKETRAAMDIGSNRKDFAVDVLKRVMLATQLTARTIVYTTVHNLQDAVLTCHDARLSHNGNAAASLRVRGDAFNLCKREFGGEPNGASTMLFHGANAGEVMYGQAIANLGHRSNEMGE